MVVIANTV